MSLVREVIAAKVVQKAPDQLRDGRREKRSCIDAGLPAMSLEESKEARGLRRSRHARGRFGSLDRRRIARGCVLTLSHTRSYAALSLIRSLRVSATTESMISRQSSHEDHVVSAGFEKHVVFRVQREARTVLVSEPVRHVEHLNLRSHDDVIKHVT